MLNQAPHKSVLCRCGEGAGLLVDTGSYVAALRAYQEGDPRPVIERLAEAAPAAQELGVSPPNVYGPIRQLVADDVLVEFTDRRRGRAWRAPEVLDLLDEFADRAGRRSLP